MKEKLSAKKNHIEKPMTYQNKDEVLSFDEVKQRARDCASFLTDQKYEIPTMDELSKSDIYKVTALGKEQTVYHNEFFNFVILVTNDTKAIDVEVEIDKEFSEFDIRPKSKEYKHTRQGNNINLQLPHSAKVTLELDNDLLIPLYILCSPKVEKPDHVTHHFKEGEIYNVNTLELTTGDVVYIEEGSVVCGRITSHMADDITVLGNGILYGAVWHNWNESCGEIMFQFVLGNNLHVEGITVLDGGFWHIVPVASKHIQIKNVNIMSKVVTGDGIDIVGCEDVVVTDCFIRTNDDCISIKGVDFQDPSGDTDTRNVRIENCVFWNAEFGNTLEIGYETRCSEICDIVFENCDVLHCEYEGTQSGGVLTIHNADQACIHDIYYKNIRIEDAQEKLIDIKTLDSRYSLSRNRGMIRNIYFEDISVTGGIFPVSIIRGFEMHYEICRPHHFYFKNITVLGEKINSANELRMVVELTNDMFFE